VHHEVKRVRTEGAYPNGNQVESLSLNSNVFTHVPKPSEEHLTANCSEDQRSEDANHQYLEDSPIHKSRDSNAANKNTPPKEDPKTGHFPIMSATDMEIETTKLISSSSLKSRINDMYTLKRTSLLHHPQSAKLSHETRETTLNLIDDLNSKGLLAISKSLAKKYVDKYKFLDIDFDGVFFCVWCCSKGFSNTLGYNSVKKSIVDSDLKDHMQGKDHKMCNEFFLNVKETAKLFDATKTKYENDRIVPLFRNVYFLAKEDLPLWKSPQIHQLSKLNGVRMIDHYLSAVAAREISLSIAKTIEDGIFTQISESDYVSLMIDDASDVGTKHHLSICIRYVYQNSLHERFVGLLELEELNADYITNVLQNFIDEKQLVSKVISLATDGATKMVSKRNGVFGKLKRVIPHLRSVHCVAHKLALGLSDLESQFQEVRTVNTLVHRLVSYFSNSTVRSKAFEEAKKDLMAGDLMLLKPISTRWLSNLRSLKRIIDLFPSIIQSLSNLSDDPYASGLLINLTRFSQLTSMMILTDILAPIEVFSAVCQKRGIKICQIIDSLNATIESLNLLYVEVDGCLGSFLSTITNLNEIPLYKEVLIKFDEPDDGTKKKREKTSEEEEEKKREDPEHTRDNIRERERIKSREQQINASKSLGISLIKGVVNNLQQRFEDLQDLLIFDIFNLNKEDIRKKPYNKGEIEHDNKLLQSIALFLNNVQDKLPHKVYIDSNSLCNEWNHFRSYIKTSSSQDDFGEHLLGCALAYPNLSRAYRYYACLPISTVENERSFSKMNVIKTNRRNRLEEDALSAFMMISINGPPQEEFDPRRAIECWKNDSFKNRLFA
jgi:hypothetical protein